MIEKIESIDELDKNILTSMMQGEGLSYAELGKKLFVSPGTIHVRIKKMQSLGIIKKEYVAVDYHKLGYDVTAFLGIYLDKSSMYDDVLNKLNKIAEVVEAHYTTGNYSMFAEIVCKDITQLRYVLHDQLQKIKGIERTETFISLEESFSRNVKVM